MKDLKKSMTMKDVAHLAGVGLGTVSRVVNGYNVKESTLKKDVTMEMNGIINQVLSVGGNTRLKGALSVKGVAHVDDETASSAVNNGALVVDGGVGIAKEYSLQKGDSAAKKKLEQTILLLKSLRKGL